MSAAGMGEAAMNSRNMARWWGLDPTETVAGGGEGLSAAEWRFEPGAPFEVAALPDPAIHIVCPFLSGEMDWEMFVNGQRRYRRPVRAGMTNLVRAGERPRAVVRPARFTSLHIYLPDSILQRYAAEWPGTPRAIELRPVDVTVDPVVHRFGRAIVAEMRTDARGVRLMLDGLTLQLAGHLVRHWSTSGSPARRQGGGLAPWQLRRACDAMAAQLDGEVALETLAGVAGCSPTHFSRAFKRSTGMPPFRWLLERRIERAKELLADPCESLAEVAVAVGFAAQPQFTTAFRRATGITPGAWRRERLS